MSTKKVKEPDIFHYREMLQMAYMTGHMIDELMNTHHVSEYHPEIRKRINEASRLMAEIYQHCGALEEEIINNIKK